MKEDHEVLQSGDISRINLTSEQYVVVHRPLGPRVVVQGHAGTGKTICAIERFKKLKAASALYLCSTRGVAFEIQYAFFTHSPQLLSRSGASSEEPFAATLYTFTHFSEA